MNATRGLILIALACTACTAATEVPVEVRIVEAPDLLTDVPAQLLLDLRTGIPTAGVEVTIEGDAGIRVIDYAPKVLAATVITGGHQIFVDVIPRSAGEWVLTARLTLHVGGERLTRVVALPLTVSSPITAQQPVE